MKQTKTDQIFAFDNYWRKEEYNETVHQLFINFTKVYDSIRGEELYNIRIQSGVPMSPVRLIKLCLNETYTEVRIGKHLSDNLRVQRNFGEFSSG
jgi:hypothetical protein